jgi:hypothetical protein
MKTFLIINVKVMMYHLLLTIFNPMFLVLICDPVPFGTPHPLKEKCILTMIDPKTHHVRKLLRGSMNNSSHQCSKILQPILPCAHD